MDPRETHVDGMTRAPGGVLVVDDQELLRATLRDVIAGIPDLVIVGEASSGEEAVRLQTS